jgi:hypothetical protein
VGKHNVRTPNLATVHECNSPIWINSRHPVRLDECVKAEFVDKAEAEVCEELAPRKAVSAVKLVEAILPLGILGEGKGVRMRVVHHRGSKSINALSLEAGIP